jgi:hypothetical protein
MPTLLEYINQLQREHKYRVKMVFSPSEKQLETIERHMKKYDALEVGRPEKLMLQTLPPDFPSYGGHEIVVIDCTTRLPIQTTMLEDELRGILRIPEGTVRAFSHDDPLMQSQMQPESDAEYEAITGTEYSDNEANPVAAKDVAGDEYVAELVDDAIKDDRRKVVLTKDTNVKASGPILNDKSVSDSPLTKANKETN